MSADLVQRTVAFCRELRGRGMTVTTGHAIDAVRALRCAGMESRQRAYLSLRCVLMARPEEADVFDEAFEAFFSAPLASARDGVVRVHRRPPPRDPVVPSLSSWGEEGGGADGEEPEPVPAASDMPAVAQKDFSTFGADDIAEIQRLAARIARRLAARPSRRWAAANRGRRIDLRRTMRRALIEPLDLRFRRRKPRKTRIVAICDVSGSMDLYSRFLLQFLYALQNVFGRVETFIFSTRLTRVSEYLRGRSYRQVLRRLTDVRDWSGGTRIGESLAQFNREWPHLVDRRTIVIVLSDGWDTGEPDVLATELMRIKRRAARLIWLNPLLGNPSYEPLTRGMAAAMPLIDDFAAGHNLAALRDLAGKLHL